MTFKNSFRILKITLFFNNMGKLIVTIVLVVQGWQPFYVRVPKIKKQYLSVLSREKLLHKIIVTLVFYLKHWLIQ